MPNCEKLDTAGDNSSKRDRNLTNALLTVFHRDIQRCLKSELLTESTYEELEMHLIASYVVKKSIIGAAVTFVTCKQNPH